MELRPGYKQTEAGVIPENWDIGYLGDFINEMTDYVAAGSFESLRNNVKVYDTPNYAIYVRLMDLRLGLGHKVQKYVNEASYKFLSKSNLFGNEILIANIGANVGEAFLMPSGLGPATIAPNMIVVRTDDNRLAYAYLYQYEISDFGQKRIKELIAGSGHPKINKTDLKKYKVIVPPLPEQFAIATVLSDVDALISGFDQLIAKKRNIKQATMQQLLTGKQRLKGFSNEKIKFKQTEVGLIPSDWEVGNLGDFLHEPPTYGINAPSVPYQDKLPAYIRITDITEEGHFSTERITSVAGANTQKYFLNDGDLVFARTGASVGKSYLYNSDDGRLVFAGFLIRVKPNQAFLAPGFLAAYVKTWRYWNWVRLMSMRSGQPGINSNEYSQLPIPLPSIHEQNAISTVLSDMDAEIASLEHKRDKTCALKQGMMQELLTGRIRLV